MKRYVLLASLFFACLLVLIGCEKKEVAPPPPPPDVKVATVLQKTVPIYVENIGETAGATDVEIRARVEGFLNSVNFTEGTLVKKGQLLYTIDPQPYEAALASARGQVAEAVAAYSRTEQDVARYKPLVEMNAISREKYDTSISDREAAKAALESAKAVEENAKLNLGYTKITAPLDGLIGKTQVKAGNLVGRGENTLLSVISNIDSIHVRSNISERDYLRLARAREAAQQTASQGNFELILADGSLHKYKGTLVFADRTVDPTTGTLGIEASFPNPEHLVRPGQYARLRAAIDVRKDAILVPQISVTELQGTTSVAVLGADNKVNFRTVQTGERVGSLWMITSGLSPGEKVVVEGMQKVRDGVKVNPVVVEIKDTPAATTQEG